MRVSRRICVEAINGLNMLATLGPVPKDDHPRESRGLHARESEQACTSQVPRATKTWPNYLENITSGNAQIIRTEETVPAHRVSFWKGVWKETS